MSAFVVRNKMRIIDRIFISVIAIMVCAYLLLYSYPSDYQYINMRILPFCIVIFFSFQVKAEFFGGLIGFVCLTLSETIFVSESGILAGVLLAGIGILYLLRMYTEKMLIVNIFLQVMLSIFLQVVEEAYKSQRGILYMIMFSAAIAYLNWHTFEEVEENECNGMVRRRVAAMLIIITTAFEVLESTIFLKNMGYLAGDILLREIISVLTGIAFIVALSLNKRKIILETGLIYICGMFWEYVSNYNFSLWIILTLLTAVLSFCSLLIQGCYLIVAKVAYSAFFLLTLISIYDGDSILMGTRMDELLRAMNMYAILVALPEAEPDYDYTIAKVMDKIDE